MILNIQNVKNDDSFFSEIANVIHKFAKFDNVLEITVTSGSFDKNGYFKECPDFDVIIKDTEESDNDDIFDTSIDLEEKYPESTISIISDGCEEPGIVLWTRKHHATAIKKDDKNYATIMDVIDMLCKSDCVDEIFIHESDFDEQDYTKSNFTIHATRLPKLSKDSEKELSDLANIVEEKYPEVSISIDTEYDVNGYSLILWPRG